MWSARVYVVPGAALVTTDSDVPILDVLEAVRHVAAPLTMPGEDTAAVLVETDTGTGGARWNAAGAYSQSDCTAIANEVHLALGAAAALTAVVEVTAEPNTQPVCMVQRDPPPAQRQRVLALLGDTMMQAEIEAAYGGIVMRCLVVPGAMLVSTHSSHLLVKPAYLMVVAQNAGIDLNFVAAISAGDVIMARRYRAQNGADVNAGPAAGLASELAAATAAFAAAPQLAAEVLFMRAAPGQHYHIITVSGDRLHAGAIDAARRMVAEMAAE